MDAKLLLPLLAATIIFTPHCGRESSSASERGGGYELFTTGTRPVPPDRIIAITKEDKPVIKRKKAPEVPKDELDFEVQNATGRTIYVCCFTYIQKEEFLRWRWDKSPVYKLDAEQSIFINVDTIPDDENRDYTFGYLAVFDSEDEARDSIYELVKDTQKIDVDLLYKMKGKTVVIDIEKYGFKKAKIEIDLVQRFKKKPRPPELDFTIENRTGKTVLVTGFIYQIRQTDDAISNVWTYDKTPVQKLAPGQTSIIDVDTIVKGRDRKYMSGFLGVFEEFQRKEADDATYELLQPKNRLTLGRLSRLRGEKVVLQVERYGAIGEITDFQTKSTRSPLQRYRDDRESGDL